MDKFAEVQRRMTRDSENEMKLKVLGCLLWRKEEQGQKHEVVLVVAVVMLLPCWGFWLAGIVHFMSRNHRTAQA